MTPGRRPLLYSSFEDVMPDVERLRSGHETVGTWSLAQICCHLATVMRRVVDLPASTPHDESQWVAPEEKQQVLDLGVIPEGLPGPPEIMPTEALKERNEIERLRAAIAHYQASPGPVIPHRFFGRLSKEEWDRLQLIHFSHHLSFAIPTSGDA